MSVKECIAELHDNPVAKGRRSEQYGEWVMHGEAGLQVALYTILPLLRFRMQADG